MSEVIGQFYFQFCRYRTGRCGSDYCSEVKCCTTDCGYEVFVCHIKVSTSQDSYTSNLECSTILECRCIVKIYTRTSRWKCSNLREFITCQISTILQSRCIGLIRSVEQRDLSALYLFFRNNFAGSWRGLFL